MSPNMNRELLESLYEYAYILKGEWRWKQGERAGNADEYNELVETIRQAEERLAKPDPEPVADMKRLSDDELDELHFQNPDDPFAFAMAVQNALLEKNK